MDVHEEKSENAVVPARPNDSKPLTVVFVVVVAGVVGLGLVGSNVTELGGSWLVLGLIGLTAVLFGTVAVIVTAQQWDAIGGFQNHRRLRRAVRRRRLPEGADYSWWESALAREADAAAAERSHSRFAVVSAVVFIGLALIDPTRTDAWIVAAVWVGAVIFEVVHARTRVAAVTELRAQLGRLAPAAAPHFQLR